MKEEALIYVSEVVEMRKKKEVLNWSRSLMYGGKRERWTLGPKLYEISISRC